MNFGQTICHNNMVLLGTSWGTTWRTDWEKGGKKNLATTGPKRKKQDPPWEHAEPPHWLHETFVFKTVCYQFWPALMAGTWNGEWGYLFCFVLISWWCFTSLTFFSFDNEPIWLAHHKKKVETKKEAPQNITLGRWSASPFGPPI